MSLWWPNPIVRSNAVPESAQFSLPFVLRSQVTVSLSHVLNPKEKPNLVNWPSVLVRPFILRGQVLLIRKKSRMTRLLDHFNSHFCYQKCRICEWKRKSAQCLVTELPEWFQLVMKVSNGAFSDTFLLKIWPPSLVLICGKKLFFFFQIGQAARKPASNL